VPDESVWDAFFEQLKFIVHDEMREMRESLTESYQPFDPARRRWVGKWHLKDEEERFAQELMRAAKLAGFSPVSRIDLERTREMKADLLSLPVTILWDRLDSRWIEAFFRNTLRKAGQAKQHFDPELTDFGAYALVLKRGLSMERHEGQLLLQKLENLQSQWLIRTGRLLRFTLQRTCLLGAAAYRELLAPSVRFAASAVHQLTPALERWLEDSRTAAAAGDSLHSGLAFLRGVCSRVVAAGKQRASGAWPWAVERCRGVRMRLAGTQILRRLQPRRYQYTYWLFDNVLKKGRWSQERKALIRRLSDAWEREALLRGKPRQRALPEREARREREEARARGDYLERIAIEHVPLSLSSLLQPVTVQEPQFQEILVAYRLQAPVGGGSSPLPWDAPLVRPLPQRPIYVRRFFEVPMKDIKMVLPAEAWRVRGRPLDMIRLDLVTLAGLLGALSHVLGASSDYRVLLPLLWLPIRTFFSHRRIKVYFKSVTSSMLFDRCLDKDAALTRLLPDAAEAQVLAECALAFWALLDLQNRRGAARSAVGEEEVTQRATAIVKSMLLSADLPRAGFRPDLRAALLRLEKWQLVSEASAGRRWTAVSLVEAPGKLRALRADRLRVELGL